jgi:cell division protein FtsB
VGGVIIDIGKTLAKAVIAGVGVELARLASGQMRKRLGVKEEEAEKLEADLEQIKRENAELKREIEALKADRRVTAPEPT